MKYGGLTLTDQEVTMHTLKLSTAELLVIMAALSVCDTTGDDDQDALLDTVYNKVREATAE